MIRQNLSGPSVEELMRAKMLNKGLARAGICDKDAGLRVLPQGGRGRVRSIAGSGRHRALTVETCFHFVVTSLVTPP